jgi:hypothetical protein
VRSSDLGTLSVKENPRSGLLKGGKVPFREFSADAALSLRDVKWFHRCTLLTVLNARWGSGYVGEHALTQHPATGA